jgi:DNA polymerase
MGTEEDRAALLAALRLQIEWGADEALADSPLDRTAVSAVATLPPPGASFPAAARAPATAGPGSPLARPAIRSGGALLLPAAAPPAASRAAELADAAGDLDALRESMARFEGSPLRETATNLVFADGAAGSGLMLIGEAPGADEDRLGLPFVGVSGRLLDRMLLSIGLRRERDFYVTNILPFRPPGNRTPTDAEIALFLPFVLRHVELASPRVLVLLGGTASKALLRSREGITRLRGRWHEVAPREGGAPWPALATLHPAYLLRNPAAKKDAWHDLLLLRRRLDAYVAGASP